MPSLIFCSYYTILGVGCQGVFQNFFEKFFRLISCALLAVHLPRPLTPSFPLGEVFFVVLVPWNNYSIANTALKVKPFLEFSYANLSVLWVNFGPGKFMHRARKYKKKRLLCKSFQNLDNIIYVERCTFPFISIITLIIKEDTFGKVYH